MAFTLPSLPYPTNALEPHIDKMTMEIHHGRHHKAYVDNLNKALEGQAALLDKPIANFCARSARSRRIFARRSSTMAAAMPTTPCSGRSWPPSRRRARRAPWRRIRQDLRRLRSVPGASSRMPP